MGEFANNRFPKYESQAQQPEPQPEPQLEPQPEQQEVIETPRQKTADSPRKSQYSFNNNEVTNFGDIRGLPSEGLLYEEPLFGQALTFMDILMLNKGNNKIYLGLGQQENHNNAYAGLMRNASIRLELYDWMYGNVTLSVLLVNAWPKQVDASQFGLDYETAKLGTFSVKFRYLQ